MLPLPNSQPTDGTVIDECFVHQGELHGIASNGGATKVGSHGFAIRFIKSEYSPMMKVQIIATGFGKKIEAQSYVRPKIVTQTVIKEVEKKPTESVLTVGDKDEI